jgi:hypothetical protein
MFLLGLVTTNEGDQDLQSTANSTPVDPSATDVMVVTDTWSSVGTVTFEYRHRDQATVVAFVRYRGQCSGTCLE